MTFVYALDQMFEKQMHFGIIERTISSVKGKKECTMNVIKKEFRCLLYILLIINNSSQILRTIIYIAIFKSNYTFACMN